MSLPIATCPPPFAITRASHVVLTVRDLTRSRAFYVDTMGFVVSDEDTGTLYLRGLEEAAHHSLVLKRSDGEARCERIGMRVRAEDDLDAAKAHFDRLGLPAAWADVPHQGRTLHVADAVGTPLEFCATMETKPRMLVRFDHYKGPCPQRIDHFQVLVPEVSRALAFYSDLGFRLSEYIAADGTDEPLFVFLQRKGNPHDIVFATGTGPRLHHFAFSVPEAYHIIHACDVAGASGYGQQLEYGPGRHGPGHALFTYFRDPDGHRIEFFNTHYQMIDAENVPVRWDASSLSSRAWGLPPRRKWLEEATIFSETAVRKPTAASPVRSLESLLVAG